MNILQQIQAYDIPTTSFVKAIGYMKDKYPEIQPNQAKEMIYNLAGTSIDLDPSDSPVLYELVLLYLIQETVRFELIGYPEHVKTNGDMLVYATEKAIDYYNNHKWVYAKPEVEEKVDIITGKPVMKKGRKQEQAEQIYLQFRNEDKSVIMKEFQNQLDMSVAGSRTYYYNLRKKYNDE